VKTIFTLQVGFVELRQVQLILIWYLSLSMIS